MKLRKKSRFVHEGPYVAEVEVSLIDDDAGWAPYLSLDDACKLDDVRNALRQGNLEAASAYGRIYELRPVGHQ